MKPVLAWTLVFTAILAGLSSLALSQSQDSQDTLKVSVDLINVPFTVTDRKGKFITGLTANDFTVQEDGRRQEISNFARENELPLTVALLIDTSPSVRPVFDEEKVTAKAFLESVIRPKDFALVIGFDRAVTLMQDLTENVRLLKRAIDDLEIGGGTSLHDAVYLAAREKLQDEAGRKAMIMISDGADTTSKVRFNEALTAALNSDSVIYTISNTGGRGIFSIGRPRGRGYDGDPATLRRYASETGGASFTVDNENSFEKVFRQIAEDLRSQYSLGYYTTNTARDGKFRQIKIVPRNSSYSVRARRGYYAAKGDFR